MNNLLTSHYFFLPAKWVTSAEVLILNIISGTGRTYQTELHKGQLAQQIFTEHRIHTPLRPDVSCLSLIFNLDQDKRDQVMNSMFDG